MLRILGIRVRGCPSLGGFTLVGHLWAPSAEISLSSVAFLLEACLDLVEGMVDVRAKLASNNELAIEFNDETAWDGKMQ